MIWSLLEQHECSTAVDLSYSVRCWIDGLQHYVWQSKVRPHDQDSALLQNSSRENARRAALSVLCAKSEHACGSLHFGCSSDVICAERLTSANNNGDGDGREKARTADGGTFARLCVRGRRKVCRAQLQLENILDFQRLSDTTFLIRVVHYTCMYSNATSASAQLACNMTVQHVQHCKYAERCGDRGPVTIPGHDLYHSDDITPPTISEKNFTKQVTVGVEFSFNWVMYQQVDRVAMGSPVLVPCLPTFSLDIKNKRFPDYQTSCCTRDMSMTACQSVPRKSKTRGFWQYWTACTQPCCTRVQKNENKNDGKLPFLDFLVKKAEPQKVRLSLWPPSTANQSSQASTLVGTR